MTYQAPLTNPNQPADIKKYVERALKDYHRLPRLARNPLTEMLDLRRCWRPEDSLFHEGLALRGMLDQVIDAMIGGDKSSAWGRREYRLEHYLDLRYRKGKAHKKIAETHLLYSQRHLHRKRDELILDVATLLLSWYQIS
jgi:hypothetical protein